MTEFFRRVVRILREIVQHPFRTTSIPVNAPSEPEPLGFAIDTLDQETFKEGMYDG